MTKMNEDGTYQKELVSEYEIKPFDKEKHLDFVKSWWSLYYHGDHFPEKCVPNNGSVVYFKGKPVASCFIYVNETKFVHIGFAIVDPKLGAGRKCFFLRHVVEAAIGKCKELVGDDCLIWSLTDHAVVGRVYQEKGFECLGEGDLFAYCENAKDIEFLK